MSIPQPSSTQQRPDRVWYAAFGSNLSNDRFAVYLNGGVATGSIGASPGARDNTPPANVETRFCDYPLMFAGVADKWSGGGVAFLGCEPGGHHTALRLHDITNEQFDDVVQQENRADTTVIVDLQHAVTEGFVDALDSLYGRVLHLGQHHDGKHIFTITSANPPEVNAPHPTYVRTIANGLLDGFGFDDLAAVRAQLAPAIGMSAFGDAEWEHVAAL